MKQRVCLHDSCPRYGPSPEILHRGIEIRDREKIWRENYQLSSS